MLNSCEFIGNLGKDPETRAIQNGANAGQSFATFSIAVNKQGAKKEDKPLWVNVTAFGKTGEFVSQYLKAGNSVFVRGPLEVSEYEGNDGKPRTSIRILADKVLSLTRKSENTSSASKPTGSALPVADTEIPF